MSMTRSTITELCDFVQHKPSIVLGNKFFDSRCVLQVDVAHKADKYEPRIFVISKFRIFLLLGKTTSSLKIEKSFHVLTIRSIHVVKEDEIAISIDDGIHKRKINIKCSSQNGLYIARQILSAIKHYFPDFGLQLPTSVELSPPTLYPEFAHLPLASPRPCHSFRRSYAALCDLYDQPYREEVSWDVEKIYTANRLHDLKIDDFSHLLPRDLLPIVGVLQYSAYFTGLICDGVRVPSDVIDVILNVIRKSHNLHKLQLRACVLPKDFVTLLASAIHHNPNVSLEYLDLSKNVLDDKKGFTALASVLPRLTGLKCVNVSECQLSDKSLNLLCSGLYNGMTACKSGGMQLSELNLSGNLVKDDISSIVNLISICTSLRVLDLSDTGIQLDKLWNSLKYGGMQIEKLLLAGCSLNKKSDGVQTAKEYFSMAVNLSHISFNNTSMPSEYLKAVLLGLAANQQLQPFRIDLDATCEKGSASVLDACIGGIRCETLSLRDNNLECDLQGVLQSLMMIQCLRRLDVGGSNLTNLKKSTKQAQVINKILLDMVKLYSEDGVLEELNLSESKLGAYLSVLLNTLGATTTLKSLDISGNEIGNFGARILSKALQVNISLRSISIDNNHIGADGFVDLATSMKMNHTLTHLPYPVQDAFECMQRAERPRAVAALGQIQNCLYRNKMSIGIDEANMKRAVENGFQSATEKSAFPDRIGEMVEDFVEQMRKEVFTDGGKRSEHIATARLGEVWLEQARQVYSDWKWREICENNSEQSSIGRASSVGTASTSSPFTPKRTAHHRPRSILVHEQQEEVVTPSSQGVEAGVNLDLPPKPSALQHLSKARPRRRPGATRPTMASSSSPNTSTLREEEEMVTSTSVIEEEPIVKQQQQRAMLPDVSSLRSSPSPRSTNNATNGGEVSPTSMTESPPPPLPQRNRVGPGGAPPPILPPKPEPRQRSGNLMGSPTVSPKTTVSPMPISTISTVPLPTTTVEDDENANSRRSVADMARIFNK